MLYMSLIVFGEWWREYIYMYVVCTEERHHPYGIWAKLASTSKLCGCDLYAQNYYCFWGPHKNKVVFFRPSSLPATMYSDPVLSQCQI